MTNAVSTPRAGRAPVAGGLALFLAVPEHDRNRQRPGG